MKLRCHDLPKPAGKNRNGPTKIPKWTSMGTETDQNGLQWVPKRAGRDFSSYRNVGLGTIGTMSILVGR